MGTKLCYLALTAAVLVIVLETTGCLYPAWVRVSIKFEPDYDDDKTDQAALSKTLPRSGKQMKDDKEDTDILSESQLQTKPPSRERLSKTTLRRKEGIMWDVTPKPSDTNTGRQPDKDLRELADKTGNKSETDVSTSIDEHFYNAFRNWHRMEHVNTNISVKLPLKLEDFKRRVQHDEKIEIAYRKIMQSFLVYLKDKRGSHARLLQIKAVMQNWFEDDVSVTSVNKERDDNMTDRVRAVIEERAGSRAESQIVNGIAFTKQVDVGLWWVRQCMVQYASNDTDCERLYLHDLMTDEEITNLIGGMATWNDLRIETLLALLTGFVGLVGTYLYIKPYCLKERRIVTCIIGICGMCISCILQILPIVRIAGIMESIKHTHATDIDVNTPWALIISGIGACFACLTSGLLLFSIWSERNHKWYKFEDNPVVFSKEPIEGKVASDADPYSVCGNVYE